MATVPVDLLLRYASGICAIGEFTAGIMGAVGSVNLLSYYSRVNIPAIRFGASVTYNNEAFAVLWLGFFHMFMGLIILANESNLVPAIKGHVAVLHGSKVKGVFFILIGFMTMGVASGLGFAFGIIYMIVGVAHFFLGTNHFEFKNVVVSSDGTATTTTTTTTVTTEVTNGSGTVV